MKTPTTNHELLQSYIDEKSKDEYQGYPRSEIVKMLKEIQSRLISPVEYKTEEDYEFSLGDGKWEKRSLAGYYVYGDDRIHTTHFTRIRHIQVPTEVSSAITLLEATGEYKITKL